MSGVSAPAYANGIWPPLRFMSIVKKNKPSTMLSSNVQSIDLLMERKPTGVGGGGAGGDFTKMAPKIKVQTFFLEVMFSFSSFREN